MCVGTQVRQRGHRVPLELELQVTVSLVMWVLGAEPNLL